MFCFLEQNLSTRKGFYRLRNGMCPTSISRKKKKTLLFPTAESFPDLGPHCFSLNEGSNPGSCKGQVTWVLPESPSRGHAGGQTPECRPGWVLRNAHAPGLPHCPAPSHRRCGHSPPSIPGDTCWGNGIKHKIHPPNPESLPTMTKQLHYHISINKMRAQLIM